MIVQTTKEINGVIFTYTYSDSGLYYTDSEDGKPYLCQRTGEAAGGTVVLHYMPHELVGHYFTEVT